MLSTPSFQAQLSSYRQEVLERENSPSVRFGKLRNLYQNYVESAENLAIMEYDTSLIGAERIYDGLKSNCKTVHQQLKQMQKNLDERTLAIEQKLYLGLPDDLKEMEKVINEQESILEDQQKINQTEEELLEKMRRIDIDHGKKLAAIEQASEERTIPIKTAQDSFNAKVDVEEKSIARKTKFLALLPVIAIPLLLDVIFEKTGIQKAGEGHLILSHYAFLISFLVMEIFFSGKIKGFIANKLSEKSCAVLFHELESVWTANNERISMLETEYGISLQEVIASLEDPITEVPE